MKKINSFYLSVTGMVLLIMSSCEKVNLHKDAVFDKGLLNFSVSIPGQSTEYAATKAGPYGDGDTIYVEVPTTEEDPLDITKLRTYASLENNSRVVPALGSVMDFTDPLEIKVTDGQGITRRHIVKVVPTLPRTVFKKLWFSNAQDLGVLRTNISGISVAGNDLLIADYNAGSMIETVGVRVYDKLTGTYKKIIAPPTTYCMQVAADDAGHFLMNRYNVYSAGFMLYYYENTESAPQLILNYTAAAGCPVNLGRKMSVIGNMKQGKAFVYATSTVDNNVYSWEFNGGVPVSTVPVVIKYASASAWTYAIAKRKSMDENSDLYLSYCNYVSTDTDLKQGSRFVQFSPDMKNVYEMATSNHYYKILDFEIFEIKGVVFMAMLSQGFNAWDATQLKVFDITDPAKMTLVSGNEGYNDFMLFTSESYGGTNYNRYGDVAVDVSGNEARIYASMATNDATYAGVMAYKMTYNR